MVQIMATESNNTETTVSKDFTSYENGIVEDSHMHIMLGSGATDFIY